MVVIGGWLSPNAVVSTKDLQGSYYDVYVMTS